VSGLLVQGEVLDPAAADREEDEHAQTAKPDGVDREEVAGEDRLAVRAQEGAPRVPVAVGRRRHTGLAQDVADRGRRDGDAELAQLGDDPQVAPARVLAGEPQNQLPHLAADRWPAWSPVRVCPVRAASRRCQRSRVSGRTRKAFRLLRGSFPLGAASSNRS